MKAIVHAKAVTPGGIIENATLLLADGYIRAVGKDLDIPQGAEVIDAEGMWVGPGFVDIHLHGDGFNARWEDDPERVAAYHLQHGSTTMVAHLPYTLPKQELLDVTQNVQSLLDAGKMPNVWAIGFEGPFINPQQGASSEKCGRTGTDPEEYIPLYEACHGKVAHWMYAPEMDPTGRFGDFLREKGVVANIGHTQASPAQIRAAVDRGATLVTHLYDAMGCHLGNESVKVTGIIQETAADGCLACPELTYEIIPDSLGIHVKPTNIKLVYQFVGPRRICIITDCTECNYDPADYPKEHFRSTPDLNFNEAHELSGSRLTMDKAFRNFCKHTDAPITDLFQMAATTPANAIGIGHLTGTLTAGKWANIVILDQDLQLQKVILRGEVVA
ncbi:MAG: amidohydrolase family protein [Oscillospiraceae bacterium]|nr:amidohydrolase family protein [Oscillospiraceae bacterium]